MQDSIFTKIINGDIPCYKVYEDDKTFAFLDIHPIQPGQVLVVPKRQVEFVWDLDDDEYAAVMATTKRIALRLRHAFPDATRIGVHIEGLDVNHAHVKVFPFSTNQQFTNHPDASAEPDHQALAAVAKKLTV